MRFDGMKEFNGRQIVVNEGDRIEVKTAGLPGGWYWDIWEDGAIFLGGPNYEYFFDSAPSDPFSVRNYAGDKVPMPDFDTGFMDRCEKEVADRYIPRIGRVNELVTLGIYPIYTEGLYRTQAMQTTDRHLLPPEAHACEHVAVSPDYAVPTGVFGEWVEQAHRLEQAHQADQSIKITQLARLAERAFDRGDGTFKYEWGAFSLGEVVEIAKLQDDRVEKQCKRQKLRIDNEKTLGFAHNGLQELSRCLCVAFDAYEAIRRNRVAARLSRGDHPGDLREDHRPGLRAGRHRDPPGLLAGAGSRREDHPHGQPAETEAVRTREVAREVWS